MHCTCIPYHSLPLPITYSLTIADMSFDPTSGMTPPTSPESEMAAKLSTVDTRANAALTIAIVVVGAQLVMAVFVFKIWLNARESRRQSADPERGVELANNPRSAPADTRPRRPQALPMPSPVGHNLADAQGRPVAAYGEREVHGENESYFHPTTPVSAGRRPGRVPTWTADSGLGEQTHGADYTERRRSSRFGSDGPHRTNTNDANYGRRGNRFAHGT